MARSILRALLCDLLGNEDPVRLAGMGGMRGGYTPPELAAAGQAAGLLTESPPASEIMADLVAEAVDILGGLQDRVSFARDRSGLS